MNTFLAYFCTNIYATYRLFDSNAMKKNNSKRGRSTWKKNNIDKYTEERGEERKTTFVLSLSICGVTYKQQWIPYRSDMYK